ncbi:hypothetical protein [Curtobacterium sp. UNCCL17]|uniref:hypothetical protein n=1 Tax=Curtobacterium sp. UNCCL17 TaxID=1449051 RepID=UPI0012DE4244|nr:hypothetical protein [Curtobacterium sp. UNCCL17]
MEREEGDAVTDRRRHVLRGIGFIVLAVAMTAATVNTIVRGPFGDPSAWVITVVFVQVLTVLFLAALGWTELRQARDRGGKP